MQSPFTTSIGHELVDLTDRIDRQNAFHCGGGRFGDVYKCKCRELPGSSSSMVAVKSVRCFVSSPYESDSINKDLRRELGLWRRLDFDHQNIVPLLGIAKGFGPLDAIVSAWMPNGTLHSFLKDAGRMYTVTQRLSILHGIASCLQYLHSIPVLHGDLTSSNILMDEEYKPRLTDFGLSSALGRLQAGMTYLNRCSNDPGAIRWAAPELFDDECEPKASADVYSFGCIMLEVLSGNIPWEGKPERVVMRFKIVDRKFPDRPTSPSLELDDEHWGFILTCWSLPEERPSAQHVADYLTDLQSVNPRGHYRAQEAARYVTGYTPTGKKRALLIAIRHVHRGAGFLPNLHFAHRDAHALYRHLIDSQGYQAEDVVLMLDDKNHPKHLWPTRNRILHQIDRFVTHALDDSRLFFYYTGHVQGYSEGTNIPEQEIIAADGKPILRHVLYDHLIIPLKTVKGSVLFALFDSSHSETLLDLRRGSGPNTYSRVWSVAPGALFKAVAISIVHLLRLHKKYRQQVDISPAPRPRYTIQFNEPESGSSNISAPEMDTRWPDVISLAACRDNEIAHYDDERQLTFTKIFLDTLAARPNISWVELRDELKDCIGEMRARSAVYLQNMLAKDDTPGDDEDLSHGPWTQEPRYSTSSHTDLTRKVSL